MSIAKLHGTVLTRDCCLALIPCFDKSFYVVLSWHFNNQSTNGRSWHGKKVYDLVYIPCILLYVVSTCMSAVSRLMCGVDMCVAVLGRRMIG